MFVGKLRRRNMRKENGEEVGYISGGMCRMGDRQDGVVDKRWK